MRTCFVFLVSTIATLVLTGCAHQKAATKPPTATQVEKPAAGGKGTSPSWKQPTNESSLASNVDRSAYFDFDSALLRSQDFAKLQRVAAKLRRTPGARVRIEGNCDERGTDAYNLALGEHRAQAAKRYLSRLGISSSRVRTVSYGKEKPKYDGHDETSWSKNRRDDFVIE